MRLENGRLLLDFCHLLLSIELLMWPVIMKTFIGFLTVISFPNLRREWTEDRHHLYDDWIKNQDHEQRLTGLQCCLG